MGYNYLEGNWPIWEDISKHITQSIAFSWSSIQRSSYLITLSQLGPLEISVGWVWIRGIQTLTLKRLAQKVWGWKSKLSHIKVEIENSLQSWDQNIRIKWWDREIDSWSIKIQIHHYQGQRANLIAIQYCS